MTPLPPGLSSEDADSHLGEVFVQIALRQFHVVRAKRRTRHFSGSKIMESNASCKPNFSETFSFYESLMYWAGVMIDTSTSMTLGRPSTLCAGILGFESEPIFQLLCARNNLFMDDQNQTNSSFITEEEALRIISFAAAHETYCSKAISVLREAIVYGHQENEVAAAQQATLNALACYRNTYSLLLTRCERSLLFLNQQTRLSWCKYFSTPSAIADTSRSCEHSLSYGHLDLVRSTYVGKENIPCSRYFYVARRVSSRSPQYR